MNRQIWRRCAAAVAICAAVVLLGCLFRYQGLLLPVRIAGGSMAEHLLGAHRQITCAECRFAFRCDVARDPPLGEAVCPNCGYPSNPIRAAELHPGECVLIDRWAYLAGRPARGDLVAFRAPPDGQRLSVKRVVGLPQESLTIRDGELFVDGAILRKTIREGTDRAIVVHDDACRPPNLPERWQADRQPNGWNATPVGYTFHPPAGADATSFDWLMYRHWRCYAGPYERTEEVPVADQDSYNQGLSRSLREVIDVFFRCHIFLGANAVVALLAHDGRECFQVNIEADRWRLFRGEHVLLERLWPSPRPSAPANCELVFGLLDQQVILAVDGTELVRYPYDPSDRPRQPTSRPLGIGARGGVIAVERLAVYRDVYYRNAWPTAEFHLRPDEYLVLGDNVPVSEDSRHWRQPGLHHKAILGKVLSRRDP